MSLTNITVNGILYTAADIAAAGGGILGITLPYNYNVVDIIAVATGGSTLQYSFNMDPPDTIFYSGIPLTLNITPSTPYVNIAVNGDFANLACRLNIVNVADASPGVVETIFNATQGESFTVGSDPSTTTFNLIAIINNRYIYQTQANTTSLYPSSVYSGTGLFDQNITLTAVTVPSTITNWNNTTFSNCNNLASIIFTEGLVTIPSTLCYICPSLTSVIIPDSVTSIEGYAFSNCSSLSNVIIGANVQTFGSNAFTGSSAPNITYTFNVNSSRSIPSGFSASLINYIFTVPTSSISVSIATSNANYTNVFTAYNTAAGYSFILEGYATNLANDNSEGLIIGGGASNLIASNNRLILNDKGINFLSPGTGELNIQKSYFRNTNDTGFYVKDFSSNLALFSSNNVGLIMQNLASTLEVVSSVLVSSNLLSLDFSTSGIGSIIQVTNSTSNFVLNLINLGIVPGQSVTICLIITGSSYANTIKIDGNDQVENIYTSVNTTAPASCSYVLQSITILRTDTNRYKLIVNLLPLNINSSVFPDTRNFTVTYNSNGGTGASPPVGLYTAGTTITLSFNTYSNAGYYFDGWRANGTGPDYAAGSPYTIPNSNTTFFAIWEPNIVPEVNR